jgi:hypothetical protein
LENIAVAIEPLLGAPSRIAVANHTRPCDRRFQRRSSSHSPSIFLLNYRKGIEWLHGAVTSRCFREVRHPPSHGPNSSESYREPHERVPKRSGRSAERQGQRRLVPTRPMGSAKRDRLWRETATAYWNRAPRYGWPMGSARTCRSFQAFMVLKAKDKLRWQEHLRWMAMQKGEQGK